MYIRDRLAVMRYQRANPEAPWLTANMIELLDCWLRPADVGLEFGSGRSTAWFASRVGRLISVEHDSQWHKKVRARLGALGVMERVDYRLCEDGAREAADTSYVAVAQESGPNTLDFVLVDGKCRDHCALACVDKLKPGGMLIVDNVNWYIPRDPKSRAPNSRSMDEGYQSETWQLVGEQLRSWRGIWTSNGVWDSAVWVKPCG
jgi:predicted O-methyltransferase YrrM